MMSSNVSSTLGLSGVASQATTVASQLPMKFGGGSGDHGLNQLSSKLNIQNTMASEAQLNGDGYMTAVYNMIFLLQTRIAK